MHSIRVHSSVTVTQLKGENKNLFNYRIELFFQNNKWLKQNMHIPCMGFGDDTYALHCYTNNPQECQEFNAHKEIPIFAHEIFIALNWFGWNWSENKSGE